MLRAIIYGMISLVVFIPVILEAISNNLNPVPRMNDGENEERKIFRNIIKTREMYETVKR